jgi:hypothetical protein
VTAEQAFPFWCIGWREEHTGARAAKTSKPDRKTKRRHSPYGEDDPAPVDQRAYEDRDGELETDE